VVDRGFFRGLSRKISRIETPCLFPELDFYQRLTIRYYVGASPFLTAARSQCLVLQPCNLQRSRSRRPMGPRYAHPPIAVRRLTISLHFALRRPADDPSRRTSDTISQNLGSGNTKLWRRTGWRRWARASPHEWFKPVNLPGALQASRTSQTAQLWPGYLLPPAHPFLRFEFCGRTCTTPAFSENIFPHRTNGFASAPLRRRNKCRRLWLGLDGN